MSFFLMPHQKVPFQRAQLGRSDRWGAVFNDFSRIHSGRQIARQDGRGQQCIPVFIKHSFYFLRSGNPGVRINKTEAAS